MVLVCALTACGPAEPPSATDDVASESQALSSWVAPAVETTNPKAFYLKVDSSWTSPDAVLAKKNVGGTWVTATNPTSLVPGPKMSFFGLGRGCAQGAGGPTIAPTGVAWTNALNATHVNGANVSSSMRWTPTASTIAGCTSPTLAGESVGFIDPVGGDWWQWTTSGPRTQGGSAFWQPFDSHGQLGSGSNPYIQGSFSAIRQPWWLTTAPHPFSGAGRLRIRTVQSVPSWRVGPSSGQVTQVKQQMVFTLINNACTTQVPVPGPCQVQFLFNTAINRSDTTDWSKVAWFQNASLWFDPAQGSLPVFDGPMKPLHTDIVEATSGLSLYTSQAETSQFAPFTRKAFDVAMEFWQFTNALKLVTAKKLVKPVGSITPADLAAYWGAAWADYEQWTLLQVEFGQEGYNPLVATTPVEIAGAWHEIYVGPQSTPMKETPVNQGFFCAAPSDRLYTCGVDSAGRAELLGLGWVDVGNNCFHHVSNNTCTVAEYAACTGKGVFCSGANHLVEYLCTCTTAPTPGWVSQGNGCYQHDTAVTCPP